MMEPTKTSMARTWLATCRHEAAHAVASDHPGHGYVIAEYRLVTKPKPAKKKASAKTRAKKKAGKR
jgi:hypothetical protein